MSSPPTAAQWVVREILGASSQRELLACRRTLVTAGRVASTLKRDLVPELSELCEDVGLRRRICNEILAGYGAKDLREWIKRLRKHGCLVRWAPSPSGMTWRPPSLTSTHLRPRVAGHPQVRDLRQKLARATQRPRPPGSGKATTCSAARQRRRIALCPMHRPRPIHQWHWLRSSRQRIPGSSRRS